jgi:hypothetical protein
MAIGKNQAAASIFRDSEVSNLLPSPTGRGRAPQSGRVRGFPLPNFPLTLPSPQGEGKWIEDNYSNLSVLERPESRKNRRMRWGRDAGLFAETVHGAGKPGDFETTVSLQVDQEGRLDWCG